MNKLVCSSSTMATKHQYDDDGYWSDESCLLKEIPEMKLPVLVKVSEGIYSKDNCNTFSPGDIIKIDSCQQIERVEGFVAKWDNNRYQQTPTEIKIPLHYNGWVNVLPIHGEAFEYTSVNQLMHYFPKKIRTGFKMTFKDLSGRHCILKNNEVLDILNVYESEKAQDVGLVVRSTTSYIILPRNLKGSFITVSHYQKYTIQEVMQFRMPQCVRFLQQGFDVTVTNNFQEAAANVNNFQRDVILTGKIEKSTILCGHYKALEPHVSSAMSRRSAVILPLDNEDVASIEVQLPIEMDNHDYEDFVLHHFSKENTKKSVEGLLYMDFSKVPGLRFIPDENVSPSTSPRPPPPPRPPRPPRLFNSLSFPSEENKPKLVTRKEVKSAPFPMYSEGSLEARSATFPTNSGTKSGAIPSLSKLEVLYPSQLLAKYKNAQSKQKDSTRELRDETSRDMTLIGELFTNRSSVTEDSVENTNKVKKSKFGIMGRRFMEQTRILTQEARKIMSALVDQTSSVQNDANVYDYIDEDLLDTQGYDNYQGIVAGTQENGNVSAHVTSEKEKTRSKIADEHGDAKEEFVEMSVHELGNCFLQCGMPKLAAICRRKTINGKLFAGFSLVQLKENPFFMTDFEITKVDKITRGWRPKY